MENSWYIRPYQEEDAEDLFKMMERSLIGQIIVMVRGRKNTHELY
ncbi:hypothetical protein ABW365_13055 [Enterococcus avium]